MTSELGVSFHSDNYAKKQNIDRKKEVTKNMNQEKPVEEVFFKTCVLRMKKLPSTKKYFIQLQISQQFVNAENLQLPPIPITPLPTNMPQIITCTYRDFVVFDVHMLHTHSETTIVCDSSLALAVVRTGKVYTDATCATACLASAVQL